MEDKWFSISFISFFICVTIWILSLEYRKITEEETKRGCLHQIELTPACKILLGVKK